MTSRKIKAKISKVKWSTAQGCCKFSAPLTMIYLISPEILQIDWDNLDTIERCSLTVFYWEWVDISSTHSSPSNLAKAMSLLRNISDYRQAKTYIYIYREREGVSEKWRESEGETEIERVWWGEGERIKVVEDFEQQKQLFLVEDYNMQKYPEPSRNICSVTDG